MSDTRLGFNCKVYANSGTTYATPTWLEFVLVSDATLSAEFDSFDATTRVSNGVKEMEPTLLGLGVAGQIKVDDDDAAFLMLDERTFMRKAMDILVLNGDKTDPGVRGWRFWAKNMKLSEDQKLGNVLFREFDLKPCVPLVAAEKPKRAVVSAGGTVEFVDASAANPVPA